MNKLTIRDKYEASQVGVILMYHPMRHKFKLSSLIFFLVGGTRTADCCGHLCMCSCSASKFCIKSCLTHIHKTCEQRHSSQLDRNSDKYIKYTCLCKQCLQQTTVFCVSQKMAGNLLIVKRLIAASHLLLSPNHTPNPLLYRFWHRNSDLSFIRGS